MSPYKFKLMCTLITVAVTAMACTDLMDLVNGYIAYDIGTIGNRPVGAMATYACDTGYILEEDANTTRTCESGGRWSGSESEPSCTG